MNRLPALSTNWKFALIVALPILVACCGVAYLTHELLIRVSAGANVEDRERTREVVNSALGAVQNQLANTATDNSYWDDAVRELYGATNDDWVQESFAESTESGVNYDLIIIVDRHLANPVSGYRKGEAFKPVMADYFSGKLDPLLDLLPHDTKSHDSRSTMLNTADGLAIVAAAPIIPTSGDVPIPGEKPRYMVFAKFLTPEYQAAIGGQYVIKDLRMVPASAAPAEGTVINDATGAAVAVVQWTDRRPGDIASSAVSGKATVVLALLASVMLVVTLVCWRLMRDIASREERARHDSLHDSLTGLPNRAALQAEINGAAQAAFGQVAIAFADLDGFKEVNDTYGHETGDRLIQAAAVGISILAEGARLVSRLGGDEFVALFNGKDAETMARSFADRLIAFLAEPFDLEGRMAQVGASVGIAVAEASAAEPQELMRRADIAMYEAKTTGKNRFCVFTAEFDRERAEQRSIAAELKEIIAARSLDIAYQPVVDARTRAIVGVEALARWPSTSQRKITPDRFIRVAESAGLIDDLGQSILARACRDASAWPNIQLAVNVSPVQLRPPDFVARTLTTIVNNGMDPGRVELEITESVVIDAVDRAKQVFGELRRARIGIVLDDFGTGFSSIGYLRQFGFNRIKIDRSLVDRVLSSPAEQALVQGITLMAKGLAAQITAEGVESEEQIDLLRLTGCSELQGYYFSRPVPAQTIASLIRQSAVPVMLAAG